MSRALAAAACAAALGCGGCQRSEPPPPELVALGLGQELRGIGAEMLGVAEVLPPGEPQLAEHAARLWSRAVRAEAAVRERLDLDAPAGETLRHAAAELVRAAEPIAHAAAQDEPPPAVAVARLEAAAEALADAAAVLDPQLPPAADGALERLRSLAERSTSDG